MTNSRSKGKRGELEAAALFREHGWNARRGQQFKGGSDSGDLVTELDPHFHFEVKRRERMNLYDALDQARRESGGRRPVVLHRKNHHRWVVIMEAADFFDLVKETL